MFSLLVYQKLHIFWKPYKGLSYISAAFIFAHKKLCVKGALNSCPSCLWMDSVVVYSALKKATWDFWEAWGNPQSKTHTQYKQSFDFPNLSEAAVLNHPKEKGRKGSLSSKRALETVHERLRYNEKLAEKNPYTFRLKIRDFFQSEYFIWYYPSNKSQHVQHLIVNAQGYLLSLKKPICLQPSCLQECSYSHKWDYGGVLAAHQLNKKKYLCLLQIFL